jgi:hypothetical protein
MVAILVSAPHSYAQENPYHVVEGWPTLPSNIKWGGVISVDSDSKGQLNSTAPFAFSASYGLAH